MNDVLLFCVIVLGTLLSIRKIVKFLLNHDVLKNLLFQEEKLSCMFRVLPKDITEGMFRIVLVEDVPVEFLECLDYDISGVKFGLHALLEHLELVNRSYFTLADPRLEVDDVLLLPSEVLIDELSCIRVFAQVVILQCDESVYLVKGVLLFWYHCSLLFLLGDLLTELILELLVDALSRLGLLFKF